MTSCESACKIGSDADLMTFGLHGADQAGFEQVNLGAAIHLSLGHFESVDMPLGLSVRPRFGDSSADSGSIPYDATSERSDQTSARRLDPPAPEVSVPIPLEEVR